ncbi:outer membrane lipoprotein LolB [Piscirickettsia litoralis]|uniref:Outer-membrane lipoprotein LolB n=2 Tax=Piscirickettsia litoralis TaxID=1891921 RepID=A0ABX3A625_9GAMM|nr:outer membrane lipoprotein LolB [Piscirickettsia litoralis]
MRLKSPLPLIQLQSKKIKFINFIKLTFLSTLIGLLSACATTLNTSAPPIPKDKNIAWQHYQQQLTPKTHWQLQGIAAVRYHQQAEQANLNWTQQGPHSYQISLSGPLGIGEVRLIHRQGEYSFTDSHGKTTHASSAQLLMQNLLGWSLPVKGLYYWVRGLADPNASYQKTLDIYGRLASLQQAGWQINYLRYQWRDGLPLPTLIRLKNQRLWLKIAISDWQAFAQK